MRDFDLIVHQFYGGHDITIVPVADVHLGAPECKEQEFIKFIADVKDTPDLYLILGGDLVNNGTRSSVGVSVYRDTMPPHQQKREMANILAPVRDRILCAVPGNHEFRATKEADDCPMYDIMAKLDLEHLYRENIAFMKIQLGKEDRNYSSEYRPTYVLTVVHGNGGGILTGGAVNRAERFGYVIDGMDAPNERIRTDSAYNLMDFEEKRSDGYYQMPMLAPVDFVPTRLIGFNYALNAKDKDYGIHFYVDDYQFERIWNNPARYVDVLREYQCILSPDFSLYMDMPMAMKIWNVYRSRLIGQIMQDAGIKVIPTISWAEPATFDWCFDGVAKHTTVSVSTVGVKRNGLETFRVGIGAMLDRLEPSRILLYGGNVDVDWRGVEIVEYKNEVTERMKGADKSRKGV